MRKFLLTVATALATVATATAQWATSPSESLVVNPAGENNYGYEIKTNANHITYVFMQIPIGGDRISMRLQILDKDGNKLLAESGKELCAEHNRTYTSVNQHVLIDKEGNAVIAVSDQRSGGDNFTIYKVTEQGDVLWSTELNSGISIGSAAVMSMANSDDGGYVFAYEVYNDMSGSGSEKVLVEKLSADGKSQWQQRLEDPDGLVPYAFPYLVDAGASQTFLVYAKGTNQEILARLIDFDGSNAWGEDIRIYNGGFSSNPLHTMLDVDAAPNGGVCVVWMNPDMNSGSYENRMSVLNNDATYAFSTGDAGTNISNDINYSRGVPQFYYDADDQAYYCVFQQFDQAYQNNQGLYMQKISLDGELLWGPDGKAVVALQETDHYGYESIQDAGDGKVAVFYMKKEGIGASGNVGSYMALFDKDGNAIGQPVAISSAVGEKSGLKSSQLLDGNHWLVSWVEGYSTEQQNICMQYVNVDGSVATGIQAVEAGSEAKDVVRTEVYSATGQRLQSVGSGFNVIREVYGDNTTSTRKVIVR